MSILSDLENKFLLQPSEVSTVFPIHSGNTVVTPLIDGIPYFTRVYAAMQACRNSQDAIYIVNWVFDDLFHLPPDDEVLGQFLVAQAGKGVDVRVLVSVPRWFIGNMTAGATNLSETLLNIFNWMADTALPGFVRHQVQATARAARRLRQLGPPSCPLSGRVLMDWSGLQSHHAKYIIVKTGDGLTAFTSGMDFKPDRLDVPEHPYIPGWHDAGVELHGEAALSFWKDFQNRWQECASLPGIFMQLEEEIGPELFNGAAVAPAPVPVPKPQFSSMTSVQILRSYPKEKILKMWGEGRNTPWQYLPVGGVKEIMAGMKKAIGQAQNYIYIECQTLNLGNSLFQMHESLFPSLVAAINRGVKVIFVTSGYKAPDAPLPDGPYNTAPSAEIQQSIINQIQPGNNNFVMYRLNDLIVHAKIILIDDVFLAIGSANFWDTSMKGLESEVHAFIVDAGTLIRDFRVQLWKEHVYLDPADPSYSYLIPDLQDLSRALSLWRHEWGTGIRFTAPGPALVRISP